MTARHEPHWAAPRGSTPRSWAGPVCTPSRETQTPPEPMVGDGGALVFDLLEVVMAAMSDQASDHVAACTRLAPGRPSGWPPVIGLPDGAQPVAVVGADEPQRPVLCIQPMTAGDARYAEGRRAGLLEAAAHLRSAASEHAEAKLGTVRGILRDLYSVMADELQEKAGE